MREMFVGFNGKMPVDDRLPTASLAHAAGQMELLQKLRSSSRRFLRGRRCHASPSKRTRSHCALLGQSNRAP